MLTNRAQLASLMAMATTTAPRKTTLLWPDREEGPWALNLWWRVQRGVPTPVGFSMLSWQRSSEELLDEAMEVRTLEADNVILSPLPSATDDVDFPRITAVLMRTMPIGRLFDDARRELAYRLSLGIPEEDRDKWPESYVRSIVRMRKQNEPERKALASPRTGRDLGDDHYREVALVYSDAIKAGHSPTAAVADRFVVSKSAAAKKVARSRERGFLAMTSRGRVGPVEDEQ